MTEGEHRVGITFNPSNSGMVNDIKTRAAQLIDILEPITRDRSNPGAREAAIAMTAFEEAAMWAVKAVTKSPKV